MFLYTTTAHSAYFYHLGHYTFRLSKHAFRVLRASVVVFGLSFAVINLVLFLIQISSLPLFARAGTVNLSWQTPGQAKVALAEYSARQQLLLSTTGNKTYQTNAEKVGITVDTGQVIKTIKNPKGWKRLPLLNALASRRNPTPISYAINQPKLKQYIAAVSLPPRVEAVDAALVIPADIAKAAYITPEKTGYFYDKDQVAAQVMSQLKREEGLAVIIDPQIIKPKVAAGQLAANLDKANKLLAQSLTISNGSVSYKLTATQIRQIISVGKDAQGLPAVSTDHAKVVDLLRSVSNKFYVAALPKRVTTLDGNVVSSSAGANGKALNTDATATAVVSALAAGKTRQTVTMQSVSPGTTYLRNYTATSAGLAALIKDFAATHGGTYAVATIELSSSRRAFYNQNVPTVPASIYKVFVSYVALKKIEQGALSFSSQTSLGSLDYCMQRAILVSDNNCAHAIMDLIGWAEIDSVVHAAGFTSTHINNSGGGYMSSTASDIANLLKELYNGSLINASDTNYLFNLMKRQIYRSGIPAGSNGAPVADKVGFLGAWNHDAGIVYAPNSTYVLVILTTNSSYTQVKELSNQIYNLYNQ